MIKFFHKAALLLALILLIVPTLASCAGEDETLTVKVEDATETDGGMEIVFETQNDAGNEVSLGWVNSCDVEVTTSEGTYYYKPHMVTIPRGKGDFSIFVEDCEGDLEKVVITELCLLNSNGLPGRELHDAVILDKEEDVEEFEESFAMAFSFVEIMFVAVPVLMVVIIVFIVISAIRTKKKNAEAMRQFNPYGANGMHPNYGAPPQNADFQQQHRQMHMQQMQMHNETVQRNMDQQHINQHTQFAQQSVTPIDQGGFIPPPPPPPPPTGM